MKEAGDKKIKQLEPTPFNTLAEHATAQEWRNAFGLIQQRIRALQNIMEETLVYQQRSIDALYEKIVSLENRIDLFQSFYDSQVSQAQEVVESEEEFEDGRP